MLNFNKHIVRVMLVDGSSELIRGADRPLGMEDNGLG